ncbi:MAG: hypothetical protein HC808_10140 [Candidatus Competibacteraceae bacterium]|nr:hypothetical protein [Candidatus Competibacteraceae bacterium]
MSPIIALVVWFAIGGYVIGKRYNKSGTGILVSIPLAIALYVGAHVVLV